MHHLTLPLCSAFLAFLAGLLAGLRLSPPAALLAGLAVAAAVVAPFLVRTYGGRERDRASSAALLAVLALAGCGLGAHGSAAAQADCRATLRDGAALEVVGRLGANWMPTPDPKARRPLIPLEAHAVRAKAGVLAGCTGTLRVRLPRGTDSLRAGTELRLVGAWTPMPAPVVGSRWPRSPTYLGSVRADSATVTAGPSLVRAPLLTLRGATEARLYRLFPRHAPLADALLLGRREMLDRELADRFAKSGLVHLLAISGTHVALLGAALVLCGRLLRRSRTTVATAAAGLTWVYLAVIGAPPSAVRAGIMLTLGLAATVLQRPSARLPSVAAAAFVILALDPLAALDIGFQLSFAGVLGIILLRGPMLARIPFAWRRDGWRRAVADSFAVSAAAFLATAPITAHHFGQVAPVSLVANLPAIPLTSLALIGVCLASLLEPLLPPLAHLVADGTGVALDALQGVVDLAVAVPGGHAAVSRPQWLLWAGVGAVFVLAMDAAAHLRDRVRWAVATGSAAAAFLLLPALGGAGAGGLEIAFLDVGQGDAVALRTPAGRWLLVDAGVQEEGWDAGARRVLPYLRAKGARRVEAMVLTHPHADHVGGARAVIEGIEVESLIDPGLAFGSPVYLGVLEAAEARGTAWSPARAGRVMVVDGVELRFLWPASALLDGVEDANEISAVIQVRYGGFSALLTGDAYADVERRLVETHGSSLRADVIKAGHHGSATSTSPEWLHAARPELVVVSAGRRNRYGHPSPVVLDRLARAGIPVARTDEEGTVVIRVEPGGETWRRVAP